VIGEVLFGVTRLTTILILIPQIGVWGCATLIIREAARRYRRGWMTILLLGIALAVAEECVIQQTSLAPLVGSDPDRPYGRVLGVNWLYFLWALGYESIWIVVLPIQLTEMVFPAHRSEPWVGRRGLVVAAGFFLVASFIVWYSWTQVFVPQFFPALVYSVPPVAIAIASVVILGLIAAAFLLHDNGSARASDRPIPGRWILGLGGFGLGLPWFALVFLAYGILPTLPALWPMLAGLAWAGLAFAIVLRWSRSIHWREPQRLAIMSGALVASMVAGFPILFLSQAPRIDVVGKVVLNVLAFVLLIRLDFKLRSRERDGPSPGFL
jgi:hypothetical protein